MTNQTTWMLLAFKYSKHKGYKTSHYYFPLNLVPNFSKNCKATSFHWHTKSLSSLALGKSAANRCIILKFQFTNFFFFFFFSPFPLIFYSAGEDSRQAVANYILFLLNKSENNSGFLSKYWKYLSAWLSWRTVLHSPVEKPVLMSDKLF